MKKTIQYEFEQGTVLSLRSIAGRTLRVTAGQVWLTEGSQPVDIVMEQRGCYRPISNQLVVLEALSDARIEMDLPPPRQPLHLLSTWRQHLFAVQKKSTEVEFGLASKDSSPCF